MRRIVVSRGSKDDGFLVCCEINGIETVKCFSAVLFFFLLRLVYFFVSDVLSMHYFLVISFGRDHGHYQREGCGFMKQGGFVRNLFSVIVMLKSSMIGHRQWLLGKVVTK